MNKIKKPWYIPGALWNKGIEMAAAAVKSQMKPDNLAQIVAANETRLLRRAIKDRDQTAVNRCTRVCNQIARHVEIVSSALYDGVITPEEEITISNDILQISTGYITEAEINAKINEVAKGLKV